MFERNNTFKKLFCNQKHNPQYFVDIFLTPAFFSLILSCSKYSFQAFKLFWNNPTDRGHKATNIRWFGLFLLYALFQNINSVQIEFLLKPCVNPFIEDITVQFELSYSRKSVSVFGQFSSCKLPLNFSCQHTVYLRFVY